MLKLLRKKGVMKKILWVVAIVIIISFGFLGTAYLVTDRITRTHAGKLFGQKVSFEKFEQTYQDVRIQAIIRYGDNFNKVSQYIDLDAETWDRLTLDHEANHRRIKISDEEVVKAIEGLGFFKKNNQFDSALYNDILRYVFRVQPRDFEESMRQNLRFAKLYEEETKEITLTEEEIMERFQKENEKVKVSYILVKPESFLSQSSFDETKAQEYFSKSKLEFLIPPSINMDFLELPKPQEGDSSVKDAVKKQAEVILQALLNKADISETAVKYNLTVKSTGFMNEENPNLSLGWPLEVLQKIFQLENGQADGPFETSSSYLIVSVKEKRDAYIPQYDEVKEKVRSALLLNQAKEAAKAKTQEYHTALQTAFQSGNTDFTATAKKLSLEAVQTPAFSHGEYIPSLGISKPFEDAAFSLDNKNSLSGVIETAAGYSVLHLDELLAATEEEFKAKRDEIIESLSAQRKSEIFTAFMTKLREKAKLEDNVSKLKEKSQ